MREVNLKTKFKIFRPFRNSKGFTLIEAMISMVILSVGILGLSSSVNSVIRYQKQSNNMTQATMLTTDKLEEIKRSGTNESAAGGIFNFDYLVDTTANGYLNGYGAPDNRTRTSSDVVGIFTRNWQLQVYPPAAPATENFDDAVTQRAINMVDVQVTTTWVDAYGNTQTVQSGTVMHKRRFF